MKVCSHCFAQNEDSVRFCPECGKALAYDCPDHHLRPGTVLKGQYQLGAAIGEGGFGITYIARDLQLNLTVAIKEFYPHDFVTRGSHTKNITVLTRGHEIFRLGKKKFLEEAQILASLDEVSGIVDVIGFFEENNTAYIVMKYLRGETLKQYLKRVGKISFLDAYRLLRPVMESLSKVHEMGMIHRDIAPDNIMLTKGGAKLLDFGAAHDVFSEDERSLSVMIKRGYSPFEQYARASQSNQGPWTDVYALCATLFHCIVGRAPEEALIRLQAPDAPLSFDGVAVDPQIRAVLTKGLSVRPEQRFQSMRELIAALDGVVSTMIHPIPPAPAPPVGKAKSARILRTVGIVLLVLAAILLGVLIYLQNTAPQETAAVLPALAQQAAAGTGAPGMGA
ncbi:MAG: protein kinase [Clostridia bacterium]|nr:protein kinase [Clostridia bacterium]